jgi:hypothetical protein
LPWSVPGSGLPLELELPLALPKLETPLPLLEPLAPVDPLAEPDPLAPLEPAADEPLLELVEPASGLLAVPHPVATRTAPIHAAAPIRIRSMSLLPLVTGRIPTETPQGLRI